MNYTPQQPEYWFALSAQMIALAVAVKTDGIESFAPDGLRVVHPFNEFTQFYYIQEANSYLQHGLQIQQTITDVDTTPKIQA
jgi:hypothetical protein